MFATFQPTQFIRQNTNNLLNIKVTFSLSLVKKVPLYINSDFYFRSSVVNTENGCRQGNVFKIQDINDLYHCQYLYMKVQILRTCLFQGKVYIHLFFSGDYQKSIYVQM